MSDKQLKSFYNVHPVGYVSYEHIVFTVANYYMNGYSINYYMFKGSKITIKKN